MLLRLYARRIVGRRSSWATSANSSLATVCSVTCNRSPAFSGSVLTERKHASNLFATRWQRCAGLILLRSGVGGLPFGFSAPMLLPVFLCARRTPGLVRYCWLGTIPTDAELFRLLASLFLLVAAVLFALSPLTSVLFVFPPVLPALLQFEWGWGAGSRGGFLLVFGFMALVLHFGALGCLAGLLGSGTVHSKLILLEYRSGEPGGTPWPIRTCKVYPCVLGGTTL